MQRKWIVIGAALLAALPAALVAQGTPRTPRPTRAPRAFVFADDNRGRIGVVVNPRPDSEADKLGAKLEGVTPGGPAAKAGLKVGDIITKFNGTTLAGLKAQDEEESGPGTKLVQLARKLEPGDTVQVEYRRGSDAKKATLVACVASWSDGSGRSRAPYGGCLRTGRGRCNSSRASCGGCSRSEHGRCSSSKASCGGCYATPSGCSRSRGDAPATRRAAPAAPGRTS